MEGKQDFRFEVDCEPLKFYVYEDAKGQFPQDLEDLITKNGGLVVDNVSDCDFELAPRHTSAALNDKQLLPIYITDCIEENALLERTMYSLASLRVFENERHDSYSKPQKKLQRNRYTAQEDEILARFISRPWFKSFKAPGSYEELARKYPQHTAYSWRERALKRILPEFEMNPQYKIRIQKKYWSNFVRELPDGSIDYVDPVENTPQSATPVVEHALQATVDTPFANTRKRVRNSSQMPETTLSKPVDQPNEPQPRSAKAKLSTPDHALASFILASSPSGSRSKNYSGIPSSSKVPALSPVSSEEMVKRLHERNVNKDGYKDLMSNGSEEVTEADVLKTAPDSFLSQSPLLIQRRNEREYDREAQDMLQQEFEFAANEATLLEAHSPTARLRVDKSCEAKACDESDGSASPAISQYFSAGDFPLHEAYIQHVESLVKDTQCGKLEAIRALEMAQGIRSLALQLIRVRFNYSNLEEEERMNLWTAEEDEHLMRPNSSIRQHLETIRGKKACENRRKWLEIKDLIKTDR